MSNFSDCGEYYKGYYLYDKYPPKIWCNLMTKDKILIVSHILSREAYLPVWARHYVHIVINTYKDILEVNRSLLEREEKGLWLKELKHT